VPDMSSYAPFPVTFHTEVPPEGEKFQPYGRDAKLKRPWVKPGTPGLLHRIGGIEKAQGSGNIDYSPANHQAMTDTRRDKVLGIEVPDQAVE
ncbi:2-oxoglutarate ferredoxin oxidoreductase subunit alpha, partial [Escherichia coli]|nr:2-oxoglutarate ferredoxin oxidoreductase subunit alpha [Escherichia coli]